MEKHLPVNARDSRDVGLIPGLERFLEKEMATHSSILAWKFPWTEEPSGLQPTKFVNPWDHKRVGYDLVAKQQQQYVSCT